MSGWGAALRIARREAVRARGRTALVVAMIALPVGALTFGAVMQDSFALTPDERADRLMGRTDAVASWEFDVPVHQMPDFLHSFPAGERGGDGKPAAEPTATRLTALLPAGSTVLGDRSGTLTMRTATGTGRISARAVDYDDPRARGILRQLSGRVPERADEVVLTPEAVTRLGADPGDTIRSADGSRSFRVVGTVEDPERLDATTIVLPGSGAAALGGDRSDQKWLVDTSAPLTWTQVKELNTHGVAAVSRHVLAHPPAAAEEYDDGAVFREGSAGLTVTVLVSGLAMLEVVLLAGPAFAVSARRRRRDLALVAAAGGTPAHLRRIMLADGLVLGAVAAVAGVAVGIVAAVAGRPLVEELGGVRSGAFRVFPAALTGLVALAVLTGVLAALVPAWIASRQDVVTGLTGRRGITRSRRRWVALGVGLAVAGAAVAAFGARQIDTGFILAGLVVGELGLVLCTPAIVGLVARLGRWLPLAPRIALRDVGRNRTAAAPAVAAVMAAVVGTLAVGVLVAAGDARAEDDHRVAGVRGDVTVFRESGEPEALSADEVSVLRASLPVDEVHDVSMLSCDGGLCFVTLQLPPERQCPYTPDVLDHEPTKEEQRAARRDERCAGRGHPYRYFGMIGSDRPVPFVIDEKAVAAVGNVPAGDVDAVVAALRAGKVVVSDADYLDGGRVTVQTGTQKADRKTMSAPGLALPNPGPAPMALMTAETAHTLGLSHRPVLTLATTTRMPTDAERDRLEGALGSGYVVLVENGPQTGSMPLLVLAGIAAVIALGATAIATGLAAADGRADLATLAAVGAAPRVRRVLSLSQSGVIAGLGSVLGAVVGVGASMAVLFALNQSNADVWPEPASYPIAVPWLNVAIAVVVVPLVAMLGAGLLTRSRLPIERRL